MNIGSCLKILDSAGKARNKVNHKLLIGMAK